MPTFSAESLKRFAQKVFQTCGAPVKEALIVADHLVTANLMGVDSHGLIRIPYYVQLVQQNELRPGALLSLLEETETTAIVDCGWNFGPVGAVHAMEVAMTKARRHHVACVVTRRCSHAGRLGAYTQLAAENGFLAFGTCNSPRRGHFVLPWGGREGRLATNPISFAVPTDFGYPILSDFSTSAVSQGKAIVFRNLGKLLPQGCILDAQGRPSTNPADFLGPPRGAILPFGRELGYRAYALALLVEILGSPLAGQDVTVDQPGNGLGLIAIDVSAFLPMARFYQLLQQLRDYLKSSPPADGFEEVLLPGEPEFRMAETRRREGIPIDEKTWDSIIKCAGALGIEWRG